MRTPRASHFHHFPCSGLCLSDPFKSLVNPAENLSQQKQLIKKAWPHSACLASCTSSGKGLRSTRAGLSRWCHGRKISSSRLQRVWHGKGQRKEVSRRRMRSMRLMKLPLGRGKAEVHGRRRLPCTTHLYWSDLLLDLSTMLNFKWTNPSCSATLPTCHGGLGRRRRAFRAINARRPFCSWRYKVTTVPLNLPRSCLSQT